MLISVTILLPLFLFYTQKAVKIQPFFKYMRLYKELLPFNYNIKEATIV